MHGAAITLLEDIERLGNCDVLLVSDFLNLAEFLGLARDLWPRGKCPPVALFMHENQLTYPPQGADERDHHYGFINITSALAADGVWFNSAFHRDDFLGAIPRFLKRMPDAVPKDVAPRIAAKSEVMHLGASFPRGAYPCEARGSVLRIGWNHRWEYDKNPETFFEALFELKVGGLPFELVVLGEQFEGSPKIFERAKRELPSDAVKIVHWGFARSREDYFRWLASCHVVVSTANHEFFGISSVEAALSGCALLLPNRLSYRELVPPSLHNLVLYGDAEQLVGRLTVGILRPHERTEIGQELRDAFARFDWSVRAADFDERFAALASGASGRR